MQDEKPVCSDTCTDELNKKCTEVPYRRCELRQGEEKCVCDKGLKDENGECKIAKKITIKFKITKKTARRRRDTAKPTCETDMTELVKVIKAQVPNVDEDSIVCKGGDVEFEVFAQDNEAVANFTNLVNKCGKPGSPPCPLNDVSFSNAKTEPAKQCEQLKAVVDDFGMNCTETEDGTKVSCDVNKAKPIGKTELDGLPFEVCKPLPCNETCKGDDRKHCVDESCVCKPQFKYDSVKNECQSICDLKPSPCYGDAVCEIGTDYQSFYCRCPPKRTGPLCQRDNKTFLSAQLNIVIVGVVLSSLLLMCFVVSASIISRLKKKLEGPSFKKDPERSTQRELRGYDGPYKASDPASLHRERDYTSL
ncbi:uncharacterized protein LOC119171877 [Rhipicephalus microplus]|nr:uncharacterized protein LOC119171877 [Rhipicephalus microplus]